MRLPRNVARLVVVFLTVALLLPEVVFFPVAVLFVLAVPVAFFVFPRVVPVLVAFGVVEARPLVDGTRETSAVSLLVVAFLGVPRRVAAPSC